MEPESGRRVERDLRSMIGDGIAFSAMVGLGETYVPAFALAAGHGDLAAGLVATLPMRSSFPMIPCPSGNQSGWTLLILAAHRSISS